MPRPAGPPCKGRLAYEEQSRAGTHAPLVTDIMPSLYSTRRHVLAALCLLAPTAAQAATPPAVPALDDIVVTASRMPQAERDVQGDVTVITGDVLRQAGQDSLTDILARYHGIEFYTSGGPQTVTGVNIRGANANQTLVLLDGVPLNAASNGMASLQALPVSSIERVEILRGAASSLYGANAVGGVINVITNSNPTVPLSARASIGVGSQGLIKNSIAMDGRQDGWSYGLSAGYAGSEGYDASNKDHFAPNPDQDGYNAYHLRGQLGYEWARGQSIRLHAYKSRMDADVDNSSRIGADDRGITQLEQYSLQSDNQLTAMWHSTLRYSFTRDIYDNITEGAGTRTIARQNQISWENRLTLTPNQSLLLAYDRLNQRASGEFPAGWDPVTYAPLPGTIDYDKTRRHNNAYTGVYSGKFGRHHLQANLRHDSDSQFGGHTTWGLNYGIDLVAGLHAYVAANTGFRAPTFNDLYYPGSSNPDLNPEKSRNIEAGLRYQDDGLSLSAVAYRNRVRDLIVFQGGRTENVQQATMKGVTLSGAYQWEAGTRVWASLDLQDPHNDSADKQLARRARHIFRIGAEHRMDRLRVGTDYTRVGKRYDDAANTRPLDAYGLWNASIGYDLSRNFVATLRWNNILDKRYTTARGYNMPRSNVFVELAWRM